MPPPEALESRSVHTNQRQKRRAITLKDAYNMRVLPTTHDNFLCNEKMTIEVNRKTFVNHPVGDKSKHPQNTFCRDNPVTFRRAQRNFFYNNPAWNDIISY